MIKPLTSLRFVFALMIFLYHLGGLFYGYNQEFLSEMPAKYLSFKNGYLGVSFFFILSGFILAFNYKDKLLTKTISYKKFILARIFRIYPLHFITFLYVFVLTIFGGFFNFKFWIEVITNLFLIQSFVPSKDIFLAFNGVSWSISNEMFFYLMFPVLILVVSKNKKVFKIVTITLFIIMLIIGGLFDEHWFYYINPLFRIFDFIIGLLIYELYTMLKKHTYKIKISSFLEVISILIFFVFCYFSQHIDQKFKWSIFFWFPMSLIILVFAFQKGKISNFLSNKSLLILGEISFAFYMVHQLVIQLLGLLNYKFHFFENGYLLILTAFVSSLVLSYLVHFYFERPLNYYLRKKYIN